VPVNQMSESVGSELRSTCQVLPELSAHETDAVMQRACQDGVAGWHRDETTTFGSCSSVSPAVYHTSRMPHFAAL